MSKRHFIASEQLGINAGNLFIFTEIVMIPFSINFGRCLSHFS